jgi:hypothetical protein
LEISTSLEYKKKNKSSSTLYRLYDLNDNREIGSYFKRSQDAEPLDCVVAGQSCRSLTEWERLLKPYMED